ncbi:MAG: tetratricopeptide repeat protein [Spirochaetales bacterium]|nr:tetratricopeptide repeat protein [Spirochaetales bacterium]
MKGADALAEDNLQEAERFFLLAAEADNSNYLAFYNLGLLASDLERLEDALKWLEKALSLKEDDADILTVLGTVHLKAGRDSEAEILFQKALKMSENEVIYNNLGTIFFRRKDYRKAKEFFRKALDINPDYQTARENIALVNFYIAMLT